MLKKLKYAMMLFLFASIIGYGFIKVSTELPQFIKDRSPVKVSYRTNPFDITFDVGNYMVYINDRAAENIKDVAADAYESISKNNPVKKLIDWYSTELSQ
jgi:hypothetical protein